MIRASNGLNLALDYLPGSILFDALIQQPTSELASQIVGFDAYTENVDHTPRNANMLLWHKELSVSLYGGGKMGMIHWTQFVIHG